jgi:uridine nucleosidase
LHSPNIVLLGVSTVHGNTDAENTRKNAARCLHAFGAPPNIQVHPGATKPLLRPARTDPEIHGIDVRSYDFVMSISSWENLNLIGRD